ncbi:hypothetical protein M947_01210 [Sulfurimonas hongkongensis]|uniref:Uncharacterized protein n=1 Tax=Sulfurimonas hongkongensis TaxID=1172190 RepID=T0JH77_9BACT|nr:hypothetical protein [Sulfurimonas hongkongensis]EQB40445.1 hypothetical protein M947_01210 [Sulfurimonas hongkongensis]
MELKYVGPKPIISHTGIEFDNNKEDKYVYLNIAVQLIKALDHDYFEDKIYTYEASTKRLDNKELFDELKKICPNINTLMEKQNHDIEEEIEHNLKRAQENTVLSEENKEVLYNNINIMHDYLIQRSINKSVYYCVIYALADMLKKDHINYIVAPLFQKFAHVLHSVQGSLKRQKTPLDTAMEIFKKDDGLFVKLKVISR